MYRPGVHHRPVGFQETSYSRQHLTPFAVRLFTVAIGSVSVQNEWLVSLGIGIVFGWYGASSAGGADASLSNYICCSHIRGSTYVLFPGLRPIHSKRVYTSVYVRICDTV